MRQGRAPADLLGRLKTLLRRCALRACRTPGTSSRLLPGLCQDLPEAWRDLLLAARAEDVIEEEVALIAAAEVAAEYAYLDDELKDWTSLHGLCRFREW